MNLIHSQTYTNMKSLILIVTLVSFAVGDKIPDFLVPGQCPKVDTEGLWRQQQPNHSKVSRIIHLYYTWKKNIHYQLVS